MQCWKCGGQTVGGVCTLCGCKESDRKPALTPAGKAMRYVYDKFGAKRALTENGVLVRCLGDVLPEDAELRRALTDAFAVGAGREFYALLESNQPLTDASFQGLMQVLRAAGLSDKDAHDVLVALWDMVGCGAPAASQPAPKPAPQPVLNRPVERPKVQLEPAERPKHAQEQPWQAPAPKPVQANVDMSWHDLLCKVVWWLAAITPLAMETALIAAHPFMFLFDTPPFEGMISTTWYVVCAMLAILFIVWGNGVSKWLATFKTKGCNHVVGYLVVIGLANVMDIIHWYSSDSIRSDLEFFRLGVTGCEELTAFVWMYVACCALSVCMLVLAGYTWNYYKDPQRRALFGQK